jgi:GNAT superfamily N-acetyltransferase
MYPQPVRDDLEYGRTLSFFEHLLREGSPCRLENEYPLVFSSDRREQLIVLKNEGRIQAGLGTLIREIEVEKNTWIKAMFVGSVVTDPEFRNRGFQRTLFNSAEEVAERLGIDVIVLWSNQLEFYQKLGFSLAGLQASWTPQLRAPLGIARHLVEVRPSQEVEFNENWFKAFDQKRFRVKRTYEEMKLQWQIPQMKVAYTKNAYALYGKGEDFQHVIHEWAGPSEEVLACIEALRLLDPQIKILSPGVLHTTEEREVVHGLESASFEARLEYLGLFKVISQRIDIAGLSPEDLRYPFFIWGLDSI